MARLIDNLSGQLFSIQILLFSVLKKRYFSCLSHFKTTVFITIFDQNLIGINNGATLKNSIKIASGQGFWEIYRMPQSSRLKTAKLTT